MTAQALPPATPSFEQARQYLARVVPWTREGETPEYVGIHWTFVPKQQLKPGQKLPWTGRAVRSVDEAVRTITWAMSLPDTRDIYVCLSTQKQAQETPSKKNTKYLKPIRLAESAGRLKVLAIDLDAKGTDKNSYGNIAEAENALVKFLVDTDLPRPSVVVSSGWGLHVYFVLQRPLPRWEWQPLANALAEATKRHGLKCDTQCTVDSVRVLRVPGTSNHKTMPPRPVTLGGTPTESDYANELIVEALKPYMVEGITAFPPRAPIPGRSELSMGIDRGSPSPVVLDSVAPECAFIRETLSTGGKHNANPLWNLTTLIATFCDDGRTQAHRMGNQHPGYIKNTTDEFFDRKVKEAQEKGLGWPSCQTISGNGATQCATCPHFAARKTPLHLAPSPKLGPMASVTPRVTTAETSSFCDPYADFAGPAFPTWVLPPVLSDFVDAQHQAMGADPSAIAMAALTAVAGAIDARAKIQVGEGWAEPPIFWCALIGPPSAMKSPILDKVMKPLRKIDADRDAQWRAQKALLDQQAKAAGTKTAALPPKPARLILQDATPEKVAEILSRHPAGSSMNHDELAGWLGSFERYSAGASSRAFYLTSWNGGPFLKDRVGQGARDLGAEIRVENLALCILGGIQPDRLAALRDLPSDGLIQRFLPVLMSAAERGNEGHAVRSSELEYAKLVASVQAAPPYSFCFASDAVEVRKRVLDKLFELEQVEGFSNAVIGAIGKLKGYFARLALVIQIVTDHSAIVRGGQTHPSSIITRQTALAAETLIFEFVLPHTFGLYDVLADNGRERDTVRAIADFILASDKDRLRPSDISAGVRKLRGEPTNKVADWASRFITMGWLRPENETATVPKAWLVEPGLRTHCAARRNVAQAARAQAHAILKAGGSRR